MNYLAIKGLKVQLSEIVKIVVDSREKEKPLKFMISVIIAVYHNQLSSTKIYYNGYLEVDSNKLTCTTTKMSLTDFDFSRFSKEEKFLERIELKNPNLIRSNFLIKFGDRCYSIKCQKILEEFFFYPADPDDDKTKFSLHELAHVDRELFYKYFPKQECSDLNNKITEACIPENVKENTYVLPINVENHNKTKKRKTKQGMRIRHIHGILNLLDETYSKIKRRKFLKFAKNPENLADIFMKTIFKPDIIALDFKCKKEIITKNKAYISFYNSCTLQGKLKDCSDLFIEEKCKIWFEKKVEFKKQ